MPAQGKSQLGAAPPALAPPRVTGFAVCCAPMTLIPPCLESARARSASIHPWTLAVLACLAPVQSAVAAPMFAATFHSFETGPGPGPLAAADLDGDGALDLVVAHSAGVSVLMNGGDGTFEPRKEFAAGGSPT